MEFNSVQAKGNIRFFCLLRTGLCHSDASSCSDVCLKGAHGHCLAVTKTTSTTADPMLKLRNKEKVCSILEKGIMTITLLAVL